MDRSTSEMTSQVEHPQPEIESSLAMNKALNIAEILELILVQTEIHTLLSSAQRVCRNWKKVISESHSIQKVLFFTPIKESEWGFGKRTLNPLLMELKHLPPTNERSKDLNLVVVKEEFMIAQTVQPNASWRRMLVQQPPIPDVGVFLSTEINQACGAASFEVPVRPR